MSGKGSFEKFMQIYKSATAEKAEEKSDDFIEKLNDRIFSDKWNENFHNEKDYRDLALAIKGTIDEYDTGTYTHNNRFIDSLGSLFDEKSPDQLRKHIEGMGFVYDPECDFDKNHMISSFCESQGCHKRSEPTRKKPAPKKPEQDVDSDETNSADIPEANHAKSDLFESSGSEDYSVSMLYD